MAYCTVEDLATALHQRVTTENTDRLTRAIEAAAREIDHDLDRPIDWPLEDPAPPEIVEANVALAVEVFKLADSAFGILGFDDAGAIRASKDTIPRYWPLLTPHKLGWGIA